VVIKNLHQLVQQVLVRVEIERMEHEIKNLWNIRHGVTGYPLSLFFSDIEPAASSNKYTTLNTYQIWESK
jgi:hypothetical protein